MAAAKDAAAREAAELGLPPPTPSSKKNSASHVPFRDSKLTLILREALTGNSRTSMLANVHAGSTYYDETLSTLRYASSVKEIKTSAVMNAECAAHDIIEELRSEVGGVLLRCRYCYCHCHRYYYSLLLHYYYYYAGGSSGGSRSSSVRLCCC